MLLCNTILSLKALMKKLLKSFREKVKNLAISNFNFFPQLSTLQEKKMQFLSCIFVFLSSNAKSISTSLILFSFFKYLKRLHALLTWSLALCLSLLSSKASSCRYCHCLAVLLRLISPSLLNHFPNDEFQTLPN